MIRITKDNFTKQFIQLFKHLVAGRDAEARMVVDALIKFDPNVSALYVQRGVLRAQDGRYEEALADYNRAVELDPEQPFHYLHRARAHLLRKAFDESLADIMRANELDNGVADNVILELASSLADKARFQEALDVLEAVPDFLPDNQDNLEVLDVHAVVLFKLERYEEALIPAEAMIGLAPDDAEKGWYFATILHAAGRDDEALNVLDIALRLDPDFDEIYLLRGKIRRQRGQIAGALRDFERALSLGFYEAAEDIEALKAQIKPKIIKRKA